MIRPKEVHQTNEIVCDHCNTTFLYDDTDPTYGMYGTKGFTCPDCGEWIVVDWDRHLPPTYPVTFTHNDGVPLSDEKINEYVQKVANALKDKEMKAGEFAIAGSGDTMVIGLKFEDEEDIYVFKELLGGWDNHMRLYFKRSNDERVLLGEYNREGVFEAIHKFLDEHNFTSYYTRVWREGDEVWLDVGSWSEFFVVVDKDREWEGE